MKINFPDFIASFCAFSKVIDLKVIPGPPVTDVVITEASLGASFVLSTSEAALPSVENVELIAKTAIAPNPINPIIFFIFCNFLSKHKPREPGLVLER